MEKTYYKTNLQKISLFLTTMLLFLISIFVNNALVLAFISFSSIITLMAHFNIFESINDTNKLNRNDLILQVLFIVISLIKFLVVSGASY